MFGLKSYSEQDNGLELATALLTDNPTFKSFKQDRTQSRHIDETSKPC